MFTRMKRKMPARKTTRWGSKIGLAFSMIGGGLGIGLGFGLGAGLALGTRTGSTIADRLHLARLGPRKSRSQKNGRAKPARAHRKIPLVG